MGASRDGFYKYPRTPHLFGSLGTADDKRMDRASSERFVANPSLIVEEKLDGTNVGIHFATEGEMVLQCRGHQITEGMHPQYDLFKQWAMVKRNLLETILGDRYILYGEWMFARHTVLYRRLPHYFFEFDILDKHQGKFLTLASRLDILAGTGIETVPVLHRGPLTPNTIDTLIVESRFDSQFHNPRTHRTDALMEGIYLRTERDGWVDGRAKMVRPEFVERIQQSTHWQHQPMVANQLASGVDIWS